MMDAPIEETKMEDAYAAPVMDAPPKGARLVHLSQLQNALTHMRTCLECQRAPKSVPSIVSEQIIGYASVLRLPCGQSMSTSPIVEPCTIIRDDTLFQLAQQQLLGNTSTLEELARTHGRYSSLDPPAPADGLMDMLAMQPASHTSADAPTDTLVAPLEEVPAFAEAAGADNENRALAEVSALLLQLALTHYVGGTDATSTTRTLLEVADMPSPPTFTPSSTFSGLLVARACILATMEAQRLAATNYGGHSEAVEADALTGVGRAPPSGSKFRGVYKYKGKERWYATISVFNELKYLGQFASEIEAARAYDRAALEYRGNKAQLNFTAGVHAVIPGVECGLKLIQISNGPIADGVVFHHVQNGIQILGRSEYLNQVMMLIGLEVGEHTSARMAASAHLPVRTPIVSPRQVAASQRSTVDNTSRLVKRARRAGLEVQPAEGAPLGSTPGVRKCGICRQPGHRMQTCPVAFEQKKDSLTAVVPVTDAFEDGAALYPPHHDEGYEGSGSNVLTGLGHSDGEALSSSLPSHSSFAVASAQDARDYASEYQQARDAAAILFGADSMEKRFKAATSEDHDVSHCAESSV